MNEEQKELTLETNFQGRFSSDQKIPFIRDE